MLSPAERLVLQVRGIDAWVAARRERERTLLAPGLNRQQRLDVAYEVEALRRTHDSIRGRCAHLLDVAGEPLVWPAPTAVIAHRHAWFVDKLTLHLRERGVTVLVSTDNGAEALGVVVADQPDVVIVGDRLAMLHGRSVLSESRKYAPNALLALQSSDQHVGDSLLALADTVFRRDHPPGLVAGDLVALHQTTVVAAGGG